MSDDTKENKMNSLLPETSKALPDILKSLYSDLAQPGIQIIGKNLAKAFDFCSLPFHVMGYMSDSVKMNLGQKLKQYADKLEKVPVEKQCPVDPQIGTPIIENLRYTTNDAIADLFTTLLANASNLDTLDRTHPSFAHLISRLSVDEARIIRYLKNNDIIRYSIFRAEIAKDFSNEFIIVKDHITLLPYKLNLTFPDNVQAYLSNLIGLGILVDQSDFSRPEDKKVYDEIYVKYDLEKMRTDYRQKGYRDVSADDSFYEVTPFGRLFIDACIKE